jgi:serine/threonine protein kinase
MVSGRRPFDGGQPAATMHAVTHQQPPPLTSVRPGVPIDLNRIVMKALSKSPAARYQSAADLVSELEQLRHASDQAATAPSSLWRLGTWRGVAVVVVSLMILGVSSAYLFRSRTRDPVPMFANLVQVTSAIGVEGYLSVSCRSIVVT